MKLTGTILRLLKLIPLLYVVVQLSGCATSEKVAISTPTGVVPELSAKAVNEALQLQGQPYVSGGKSPAEGFDCSGLIYYIYNKHGVRLPRDTWSLASQLPSVQLDQRQPGDLVFFTINSDKPHSHVGIYVGQDKFVHAPSSRTGRVMMSDLKQPYWRERFSAVRRPQLNQPLSLNEIDGNICLLN